MLEWKLQAVGAQKPSLLGDRWLGDTVCCQGSPGCLFLLSRYQDLALTPHSAAPGYWDESAFCTREHNTSSAWHSLPAYVCVYAFTHQNKNKQILHEMVMAYTCTLFCHLSFCSESPIFFLNKLWAFWEQAYYTALCTYGIFNQKLLVNRFNPTPPACRICRISSCDQETSWLTYLV